MLAIDALKSPWLLETSFQVRGGLQRGGLVVRKAQEMDRLSEEAWYLQVSNNLLPERNPIDPGNEVLDFNN